MYILSVSVDLTPDYTKLDFRKLQLVFFNCFDYFNEIFFKLETILPNTLSDNWDIVEKENLYFEMVRFIYKNQCYGLTNHLQIWCDFKKKYPNLKISDEMLKDLFFFEIQMNWIDTAPVTVQTKNYCSSIEGFYCERREVLANNDVIQENNLKSYPNVKVRFLDFVNFF